MKLNYVYLLMSVWDNDADTWDTVHKVFNKQAPADHEVAVLNENNTNHNVFYYVTQMVVE